MARLLLISLVCISISGYAQFGTCDCTANVGAGNVNFSTLTWTGSGCPTSGSSAYTGNLCVNLVNTSNLIMDKNFTITGNFKITNSGNSTFTLPSGFNLSVSGNMGDNTNNNVTFVINGNLTIGGTLYGKNSNAFSGSGTVTAGGLDFNQEPSGGGSINWDVGTCVPAGTTFCNNALPIVLSYFNATILDDNSVSIEWGTESEKDFDYFEIQRGNESFNFTSILKVQGAGYNTETLQRYSATDTNPLVGTTYYRLKAVDLDGSYEFFRPVSVTNTGGRKVSVAPNPVKGNVIRYSINFEPLVYDRVILMDAIGNEIQNTNVTGTENELVVDQSLKPGTYLLRYNSTSFQKVTRVFVTN